MVATLDALTHAANPISLQPVEASGRHRLIDADICNRDAVRGVFGSFRTHAVMYLAAESHVDRSIPGPGAFVRTNVIGT